MLQSIYCVVRYLLEKKFHTIRSPGPQLNPKIAKIYFRLDFCHLPCAGEHMMVHDPLSSLSYDAEPALPCNLRHLGL